ncbi:hypothetical protein DFH28DRAFT_10086 [Melampsora americana]|nr:hypothetical protein DFH28DRAFT_10086 [Melampsora americana]
MVLVIAILNDGTVMTISLDRVLPSNEPDHWDLTEIFTYAVAYGLHLALSTVLFYVAIVNTTFFEDTFGIIALKDANDPQLHMVIYLQVAIISQALIFITRSHGWFFMERPSFALMGAFVIAQTVASLLACFGDLEFSSKRRAGQEKNKKVAPIPSGPPARTGSYYSNRTSFIQRAEAPANQRRSVYGHVQVKEADLRRFSVAQAVNTSAALNK